MNDKRKVFISYSWDNESHKEWVLKLANDLEEHFEIDVIFDQYELSAGKDMTYFMEKGMTADKILVILTPNYKTKAEKRKGGVGFEYSMITNEMFDDQLTDRIIPVLREGTKETSIPQYIKTKVYHNMQDDTIYQSRFFELLRIIFDKPQVNKPVKTKNIDLSNVNEIDELIEIADNFNKRKQVNFEIENILSSKEGLNLANAELDRITEKIKEKVWFYEKKTRLNIRVKTNYRKLIKINTDNFTFQFIWTQPNYNSLQDARLYISFWKGYLQDSNDGYVLEKPKLIYQHRLIFDMNLNKEVIWNDKEINKKYRTEDLIKLACDEIIINEIKEKSKQLKR